MKIWIEIEDLTDGEVQTKFEISGVKNIDSPAYGVACEAYEWLIRRIDADAGSVDELRNLVAH